MITKTNLVFNSPDEAAEFFTANGIKQACALTPVNGEDGRYYTRVTWDVSAATACPQELLSPIAEYVGLVD